MVKFVKRSVCIHVRYGQPLISKDCNYTNRPTMFIVQQILDITFEFTRAARGFMIISCAARGTKKVGLVQNQGVVTPPTPRIDAAGVISKECSSQRKQYSCFRKNIIVTSRDAILFHSQIRINASGSSF